MSNQRQNNDTLRNLLVAACVFTTVMFVGPALLRPPKEQQPPPNETGLDEPSRGVDRVAETTPSESPADRTSATPRDHSQDSSQDNVPAPGGFVVVEAPQARTVELGAPSEPAGGEGPESPYRMHLLLSSVGASVVSATLSDHAETLGSKQRYQLLHPVTDSNGKEYRSLAVERISLDGTDVYLADKKWHLIGSTDAGDDAVAEETADGQRVRFALEIHRDNQPILRLTRSFDLSRQTLESHQHDLRLVLEVENLDATQPHRVRVTYRGGVGVKQADTRMDDRVVDGAIRGVDAIIRGERITHAAVVKDAQYKVFDRATADDGDLFSWAATGNKYFTCTLAPLAPSGSGESADISNVLAVDLDGKTETTDDVTLRFVTSMQHLEPGQRLTYPVDIYIGEKDGGAFKTVEPYRSRNYYFQVVSGYSMCTFNALVELMIWALNGLHFVFRDFGVAIIALVLVVRILLHPITKKGQVNMVRMQQKMGEFSPKIEELKKRFGSDKTRLQQETMKLYREHNINPAGQLFTCLPMVIQMPIWVALFISLSNNVLMRHQPFLFTWIQDLTAQDALITFASPVVIPILGAELPHFNLLPFLLAITMYAQQKLQPKPKPNPNASDQQRQQQEMMQKMMPMMSIMMLFIFYKMPSGLNLYIMASSLFGTFEQYRIRKHIREQEDAGTLHKPVKPKNTPPANAKPSFWQQLQAKAEQAQHNQPRSKRTSSRRK